MHHKRKRPRSTRSGCLMCKPWKRQGSCVQHRATFRFNKSPFASTTCTVLGCATRDEAAKVLASMLIETGYSEPTWREWWRWRIWERRLPAAVKNHMAVT